MFDDIIEPIAIVASVRLTGFVPKDGLCLVMNGNEY
jgi:hypothetical protein